MTDTALAGLVPVIGVRAACRAVGAAQASWYRRRRQSPAPRRPAPIPHRERMQPRALSEAERKQILAELHSDRFVDVFPAEVWAILLDEGRYLGSISTFYRLLRTASGTRERRRQATHPASVKPELVATGPNAVWSWDITKLRGPQKWSWFYLYVILDIYSRYVVGWMVASRESAGPGRGADPADRRQARHPRSPADHPRRPRLIDDLQASRVPARRPRHHTIPFASARLRRQSVQPGPVQDAEVPARLPRPVRLDRGRPAALPALLPLVQRRASPTGLGLHTAADVHYGLAEAVRDKRAAVLAEAHAAHPERFVHQPPQPPKLPTTAWINRPDQPEENAQQIPTRRASYRLTDSA